MAVSKSTCQRGPKQVPKTGYRFLEVVLDGIDDGPLLDALGPPASTGRPGFSARAMLRAYLSKFVLGFRYNLTLLEGLQARSRFRQVCGFTGRVPSESTLSRFTTRLVQHQDLVDQCRARVTDALRHVLPGLGETVAVDSTTIESFSNPNRKVVSDPGAWWGVRHSSKAKQGETAWVFGYKMHLLADADYGIPLSYQITPANQNDSPLLPQVLREARRTFDWLQLRYVLADRGYDSNENHRAVVKDGAIPIIHIRKPTAADSLNSGVYTVKGTPTCMGQVAMDYVRTDPETGRHLFQCPAGGCRLKAKNSGAVLYCDSEVWEDPMENLRVVGIVWRGSREWERHYAKRWSIERVFRSLKHSRGLEGHHVRGKAKIRLLASLSLLTYQATALARAKAGTLKNLRQMRVRVA